MQSIVVSEALADDIIINYYLERTKRIDMKMKFNIMIINHWFYYYITHKFPYFPIIGETRAIAKQITCGILYTSYNKAYSFVVKHTNKFQEGNHYGV